MRLRYNLLDILHNHIYLSKSRLNQIFERYGILVQQYIYCQNYQIQLPKGHNETQLQLYLCSLDRTSYKVPKTSASYGYDLYLVYHMVYLLL